MSAHSAGPWSIDDGAHPTMTGAIRQLLADLAAVSAERDLLAREISEADDLARHFVRDRPTLRARGAIVLQADEIGKLRSQIAEYENAPVVATVIAHIDQGEMWPALDYEDEDLPPIGTELIARKVKK